MSSRQPKLAATLRLLAAGCVLLWLAASSYCSIDDLIEWAQGWHRHQGAGELAVSAAREAGTKRLHFYPANHARPHDGGGSGHDSHPHHGDDHVCCSTLHPTAQTPASVLERPVFHPASSLSAFLQVPDPLPSPRKRPFDRRTRRRQWVFTPEVCLGPAFRSLAPPRLT